ncbi:MAG: DUF11 domain-containing protein [Anaerolineales bacterium]
MRASRLALGLMTVIVLGALLLSSAAPAVLAAVTNTPSPTPVTPTPTGPTPTPGPGSTPSTPPPPPSGAIALIIAKTGNALVANVGSLVEFTITVTNPSTEDVQNVAAYDPLPPELGFVSASCTQGDAWFDGGPRVVNFNLLTIVAGQAVTCTLVTRVNDNAQPPNPIVNNATLLSNGTIIRTTSNVVIQTVPGTLPQTGFAPLSEAAPTILIAALALLLPLAAWWLLRRFASR